MNIIGRSHYGDDDVRATATYVGGADCEFEGCTLGNARVRLYRSDNDMDRGGLVICLTVENADLSMLPVAREIENGVELHMAGDEEADALCRALQCALSVPGYLRPGAIKSIKVDVVPPKHD